MTEYVLTKDGKIVAEATASTAYYAAVEFLHKLVEMTGEPYNRFGIVSFSQITHIYYWGKRCWPKPQVLGDQWAGIEATAEYVIWEYSEWYDIRMEEEEAADELAADEAED